MTDVELAHKIHGIIEHDFHGDSVATNLVKAARHSGLRVSMGCALVEDESGFKNVFGHDPTIFSGGGRVTRVRYLAYKALRKATGKMQGVGYVQLTWYEYQDEADKLGGCWKAYPNMLVGFRALAANIQAHGEHAGIAAYNGSGPAAEKYADLLIERARGWHDRLT